MSESVSIEFLRERFPSELINPFGEVLVIPSKQFQHGWALELEAQGHRVFVGNHKGNTTFLVRVSKGYPLHENPKTVEPPKLPALTKGKTINDPEGRVNEREFKEIPTQLIESSATPSREVFEDIGPLAATIKRHGLLEPILVKKKPAGYGFQVVVGERRLRACKQAEVERIPCIIVDGVTDEQILQMQLVENAHRNDLKVFEEVKIVETLRNQFKLSYEEIAIKTGLSHGTVQNYLTIARLPPEYVRMIGRDSHDTTQLTVTKALLLAQANLPADKLQETVGLIKREGLSRAGLAKKLAQRPSTKIGRVRESKTYWKELTKSLREYARYWSDYSELKEWETVSHYHLQLTVSLPKDLKEGEATLEVNCQASST